MAAASASRNWPRSRGRSSTGAALIVASRSVIPHPLLHTSGIADCHPPHSYKPQRSRTGGNWTALPRLLGWVRELPHNNVEYSLLPALPRDSRYVPLGIAALSRA